MSSANLNNLSIKELKKLIKDKNEGVKKLEQETEKEKLILAYKRLLIKEEKLTQEKKEIKQKNKRPKFKPKSKPKFKPKLKPKSKSRSYQGYYQECIKGKDIPKDTPYFLKKALKKAKKVYEKGIILEKSALANFSEKYTIEGKPGVIPWDYVGEKADQIKYFLRNYRNIKVRMILVCLMERQVVNSSKKSKIIYEQNNAYFQSQRKINLEKTEVKDILKEMIKEILNTLSIYLKNGSGWYFKEVIRLEVHIVEYKAMKGGSYIPLPNFIMRKKAIINMENGDNKCFLWSILRYLHPREKHSPRISDLKKYENDLNFKEINFPVKVKDITKFENQNPVLPGINIFSVNDNNKVYPLRINQKDCQKSLDLFFHSDGEKQHYSLIKNFTRLVRSQYTSHKSSKIYICKKCLTHYTKEDLLEKHIKYCGSNETTGVKMPTKENSILKFKHHFKKLSLPFIIYADFECFTIPVNSCQPNPEKSYTKTYQKHEPSGFCLYLKTLDGMNTNFKPILYTKKTPDEDISKKFIKEVIE